MSAAAVIMSRQNRLIRSFRRAGAVSAATARPLEEIDVRESWIFRRMCRLGVFVSAGPGRWFLDEHAAAAFIRRRYTAMIVITGVLLLLALLVVLLS